MSPDLVTLAIRAVVDAAHHGRDLTLNRDAVTAVGGSLDGPRSRRRRHRQPDPVTTENPPMCPARSGQPRHAALKVARPCGDTFRVAPAGQVSVSVSAS